jgi:hypothetical protein
MQANQEQIEALQSVDQQHKFGVLATSMDGEIHLSSIRYALTPRLDVALIYRAATLKSANLAKLPRAAFQIDNRSVGSEPQDVASFVRATFAGAVEVLQPGSKEFEEVKSLYLKKIPEAEPFFKAPDIQLCLLRASQIRYNKGAGKPTEVLTPA